MSVSGCGPLANRTEDSLRESFQRRALSVERSASSFERSARRGVFDGAGHMIDDSDRWPSSLPA